MYGVVEDRYVFLLLLGRIPYISFGTRPPFPTIPTIEMLADNSTSESNPVRLPTMTGI